MSVRSLLLLLTYCILQLVVSAGGELILYVQSKSAESSCPTGTNPDNCKLLSEYATDQSLLLESDTAFEFLPGDHDLYSPFYVGATSNVSSLSLKSLQPEQNLSITCYQSGAFYLENLQHLELTSVTMSSCNATTRFIGNATFQHCSFTNVSKGPALLAIANKVTIFEDCSFMDNRAPMLYSEGGTMAFIGSDVTSNSGAWILTFVLNNVTFTGNRFTSNFAYAESILAANSSVLEFVGTNLFRANLAKLSTLSGFNYTLTLGGNTSLVENRGEVGGVIVGIRLQIVLSGNVYSENNVGELSGGVFCILNSECIISGDVAFVNNHARFGGAFCLVSSKITFLNGGNNVTFVGNSARSHGGAMSLLGDSSLNFLTNEPGSVKFEENFAGLRGGGVYIQDSNALSNCLAAIRLSIAIQSCSFEVLDYDESITYSRRIYFINNRATEAGSAIYGGAIDSCIFDTSDDAQRMFGRELFNEIVAIDSGGNDTSSSAISSDPYMVCSCVDDKPSCENGSVTRTVYPGASIEVKVVALGQRNGTVPATIIAVTEDLQLGELEVNQRVSTQCNTLTYTVYADPGNATIELYVDGPCLIVDGVELTIVIEVLDCPPGFVLETSGVSGPVCTCNPRLVSYTDSCNPQNGMILRDDNFWVGYDPELDGLILYPNCPFDYCITDPINFTVEEGDAQCEDNRAGLLCGECSEGLSLLLGSFSCAKCSDNYLALLLFFAAAGLILVKLLLLLNLTVAVGTINGLIFYANIVAANDALIFPRNSNVYLDILRVFIAWINLDFGIESCFYDGMDAYAQTWLQYVFPLYIWILIGLVFIVSHFSVRVSRFLGSNPVAVFATLILLSYTKVLRTIVEAFSSAILDYPEGETRSVWLYDGNVPFLDTDDGRHLGLFVASLLILLLIFIPYTLLLLTSQWLQIESDWKILSWLNKPQLRAFLDAYHAPYKPRHRYWTGLLLIIRFTLQLTASLTMLRDPVVNFLVIQIFVLLVQMWGWVNGGIYRKWYLNVLEAFFFLNLGLLAAVTYHVNSSIGTMGISSDSANRSQTATTSTLVSAAVATFIGIVIFHIYKYLTVKCIKAKDTSHVEMNSDIQMPVRHDDDPFIHVYRVTTTVVGLRESLLEEH